ncbi:hypothetical protein [Nocardia sp. NPDC004415]
MTQWLPLLGSLPVAGAVLVGVFVNNRTHREGIAAADERGRQALDAAQRHVELSNMVGDQRDHEAWRREAVLAAVASILETSASVRGDLASCGEWDLVTAEEIDGVGAQIHKVIWDRPGGILTRLRVVAHRRIPNKCEDLLRTLTAAQHITMQRLKLHIDVEATVEELEEMASLWQKAMRHAAEQERALVEITRLELGIEIASKGPAAPPVPAAQAPVAEPVAETPTAAPEPALAPEEHHTAVLRVVTADTEPPAPGTPETAPVADEPVAQRQAEPAQV